MFHGAWRCPKAMASSSTRESAPPPGTRIIWVIGDTGLVARPTSVSIASSGSSARKSAVQ